MPRPDQPNALHFDTTNITEFLGRWDSECDDFDFDESKKCIRLSDYCTLKNKETIQLLFGYKTKNWTILQSELQSLFWEHHKQKDTTKSLNKLVQEAPMMDLNVYLLKYASILDTF